jgi:hypothetical protein
MLPVARTTASNGTRRSLFQQRFEQTAERKSSLVTVHALSELLTWLSKQLQKWKIHYRRDAHKGHSVTLLQYGHRISVGNALWIRNKLSTLTIQINFVPWFWKDLHPAILEAPRGLMFRSIRVLKVDACSVSLQPICEQAKHMPVMSEWKHWWVSMSQWEHLLWTPKAQYKAASRILMQLATC